MQTVTLSCRCGSVRLKLSGSAMAQFYCHCDDCRAVTGGAFVAVALFQGDSVSISGNSTFTWTYRTLPRTRCSNCGMFLFGEPPGSGIRAVSGFLLPVGEFQPLFHIHCQHAVIPVKDDLPHFRALPAAFGGTDETVGW